MTALEIAERLEDIYRGEPWFGESLQTKLKSVTADLAYRQPVNNKHSIAEILSHMEYWRKSFICQIKGDTSLIFSGESPENWVDIDILKSRGWKDVLISFEETNNLLVGLIRQNAKTLPKELLTGLNGLLEHDVYHLGQIGIIKSLVMSQVAMSN